MSGLDEIIARLPNNYETELGRGFLDGTELSVGEWQRVRSGSRHSPPRRRS